MNSEMQKKIRSSAACRRRLDDLYRPILDRIVNGEFNEEGGSDAYDRAIAELKEAYLATPNLGCMINEAWKIFIDSNTLAPVEMVDLDEADLTTTQQGASLVEKVGLGESKEAERAMAQPSQQANLFQEVCGGRNLGDCRRPDGRLDLKAIRRMTEDALIQAADDPELRSELSQDIKEDNMDTKQKKSSAACRARIHELFQPIKEREDSDVYKGEGGHTLYQHHILEAQQAYLDTPKLGVMKWREMEKHLSLLSDRSIVNMDISATDIAKKKQEIIVKLVVDMAKQFQKFRETFQEFVANRSELINWLLVKAISLDEKQKQTNKDTLIATSVSTTSSAAGIVVVSVALAPITFGATLALGLGFGTAAVGIASGVVNFKLRREKRNYDLNALEEAHELQKKDRELQQKIKNISDELVSHGKEILREYENRIDMIKELNARFGKQKQKPADQVQMNQQQVQQAAPMQLRGQQQQQMQPQISSAADQQVQQVAQPQQPQDANQQQVQGPDQGAPQVAQPNQAAAGAQEGQGAGVGEVQQLAQTQFLPPSTCTLGIFGTTDAYDPLESTVDDISMDVETAWRLLERPNLIPASIYTAARVARRGVEVNDFLVNAAKMGIQVADDVADAAKLAIVTSKAIAGVAIGLGVISVAWDIANLVLTGKDLAKGSKSKLGVKLREAGQLYETNLQQIIKHSESAEEFVDLADERLRPLMKRYPLTFMNAELNDDYE